MFNGARWPRFLVQRSLGGSGRQSRAPGGTGSNGLLPVEATLAAARGRPAILTDHAVARHLHPHRVTVAALVARVSLHQGLGPELDRVLLGRGGRDGVEFGFVEDGGARLDLQRRGGLEGRDG